MTVCPVRVPIGYRVGGYRVTGPLGSGSWGSVYAAEGVGGPHHPVALKFLPSVAGGRGPAAVLEEIVSREKRYARSGASPYLVRTFDVLEVCEPGRPGLDGCTVLVMERARTSLRELLRSETAGTPVPRAGQLLAAVCSALAGMHRRGLVHGDLKPGNVLLMPDGSVRLADFGLTTEIDGTHGYAPQLGSPDHLPPEWWTERATVRGVPVRTSTDIWGFGILAHLLLTGGFHPFPGATPRARALAVQAYARGSATLRLHEAVPAGWRPVINDCLQPDHEVRAGYRAADLLPRIARTTPGAVVPAVVPSGRRHRPAAATALAIPVMIMLGLCSLGGDGPAAAAGAAVTGPPPYLSGPGELRASADVPVRYRKVITDVAHACAGKHVTPALIAAMLKAESGFDPRLRDDAKREYGIARWTPEVFRAVATDGDGDGRADLWSPYDAIASMGRYLCWLDERFTTLRARPRYGLADHPQSALIAAGYRTSVDTVVSEHGPPPSTLAYVRQVTRDLTAYDAAPPP